MLFNSLTFLRFFVIVFAGYWLLRNHRARMAWLLGASVLFYMRWNPWFIGLILFSASVDYAAALAMERWPDPRVKRGLLFGSISVNLGLLVVFKYANFFLATSHSLGGWLGFDLPRPVLDVVLPLGISFYTFETISYVVDVSRGKIRAERNPLDYFLFILFFPHLIAGPIVRAGDFLPQTRRAKRWSWSRAEAGVRLFVLGFLKKVVIADRLAMIVDPVYANPEAYGTFETWLAAVGYSFQVYGDFSGYSDMAIGLAHLFGFKLHANFHLPFAAANPVELWQRWHISLSTWFRDYLYIPLGGSRGGHLIACRNILIIMTLSGFWHGAAWNPIIWGVFHGIWLAGHRLLSARMPDSKIPRPIAMIATFLMFTLALVIFRASSLADTMLMLRHMVVPTAGMSLGPTIVGSALACLAAGILGHIAGSYGWDRSWDRRLPAPAIGAALAVVLAVTLLLIPETGAGFIYFHF